MLHGVIINSTNTLTAYGLFLCADLNIGEPTLKENLVDIPGGNGALNMSYSPQGMPVFNNREISFTLAARMTDADRATAVSTLRNLWHGREVNLTLPDDLTHYWHGIISFGDVGGFNKGTIPVRMTAEPYKYKLDETAVEWSPDNTLSGEVVSFEAGGAYPLSLSVAIDPVQSGSGDPSPSNIRPISGRTGATVQRTGINVWDEETESGYINADGSLGTSSNALRSKNFCPCVGGLTYYFRKPSTYTITPNICWYDADKTFISRSTTAEFPNIPAPSNARYFKVSMWAYGATYNHDISINYPSTDTDYHAYNGSTVTLAFGDTVYGGTLDVTAGKLTVDRAMVDLGTLNWRGWTDSVGYIFNVPVSGRLQTRKDLAISSQYTWNASVSVWADLVNGQMTGQVGGENVYVRDTRYSSIADFKTGVSGVQLVYPLATPIEVDLTPTEITTLLGTNNIFADCGEVSMAVPFVKLSNERMAVVPYVSATAETTLAWDGYSVAIGAGNDQLIPQLVLEEGETEVGVATSGTVTFRYREGSL